MSDRRKFVKLSLLSSAAVLTGKNLFAFSGKQVRKHEAVKGKPVVISTWDFGKEANAAAWNILTANGRALDAVETGVKVPEANPNNQSVGLGGRPDRDGHVTLDACIMDENTRCGSVACLEHIVHPISVARLVMEKTPHVMLVGEGALQFALANGFKKQNLLTDKSYNEWQAWLKTSKYEPVKNIENQDEHYHRTRHGRPGDEENHDTIGMVAMDSEGNLSGACTTSGLAYKLRGRVGDSPIIGAGLYVDNEIGAAAATGVGEEVIRIVGSHLVVELMRQGLKPADACKKAVERIIAKSPSALKDIQVGFIALNKKGEYGAYSIHPKFSYAVKNNKTDEVFESKSHF
jgi:N4-(beta-N-acetylglucosaminyl)-L-asparaginase